MKAVIGGVAALLVAVLLGLLGLDLLRSDRQLKADDARFAAAPLAEGLWQDDELLPLGVSRRLLGFDDDLAYRRGVSLYVRSRPGEPTSLNPQREALRAEAQRALGVVSREGGDAYRRSQAAVLLALLALGRGDLFTSEEERLTVLRGGVGNLQIAVALDPNNPDAKRNLELALTSVGLPPSGATDAGGSADTGDTGGVGRSGTGY
jgi:hypothetical protein